MWSAILFFQFLEFYTFFVYYAFELCVSWREFFLSCLFGVLNASFIWLSISFPRFGKFFEIILLKRLCIHLVCITLPPWCQQYLYLVSSCCPIFPEHSVHGLFIAVFSRLYTLSLRSKNLSYACSKLLMILFIAFLILLIISRPSDWFFLRISILLFKWCFTSFIFLVHFLYLVLVPWSF